MMWYAAVVDSLVSHIRVAMDQAGLYRLDQEAAQSSLDEVRDAIADCRTESGRLQLPAGEVQRMEPVIQA